MFISINYSKRPAPAKGMKHSVKQLKDKDFTLWTVTLRSRTRIRHRHVPLTARTPSFVNLILCFC